METNKVIQISEKTDFKVWFPAYTVFSHFTGSLQGTIECTIFVVVGGGGLIQ